MKDNLGENQIFCKIIEFSKKGNFLREVSGITTPIPLRSEAQSLNQESKCFLWARIIHLIHSFDSCFNILIYHTNCDHIFYKWLRKNESSHCWLFLSLFILIKSLRYLEISFFLIYSPKNSWSNAFKPESIIAAITAGLHQIWSYIVASWAAAAVLVSPLGIQPSNFQLARTPFDGQAQMMRTSVITTFEQNHRKNTPSPSPPPPPPPPSPPPQ